MTTALAIIIFVLAAIYCGIAPTREEVATPEGASAEQIERVKRKISLLSIIASDKSLFVPLVDGGLVFLGGFLFLGIPVIWLALFSDGWDAKTKTLLLSPAVGIMALMLLWGKIQHFCRCQSLYLKNKLQFLEELDAAKRNGCDEATLNAVKQVLERELQRRNEVVPRLAHIEMIDEYVSRERREGSLSARYAKALSDEASARIESGEWLPGGKPSAHSPALAAWQASGDGRVATDENGKQLTIWDALMGRKSAAAQAEPEQKEETGRNTLMRTAEDVVASEEAAIEQLESYEGELKELAQEEIKMRRDAIRHAQEGDPEMARLLVGAANFQKTKREVLENRNRRIQAKQEQLSAQQAAQAEPKQVEADSIRALLGARIKEMEAILERLQAERERLANVASAEELDALEMEIRARQKLIHAINQGADDMELHLCVQRVQLHEENRKEFEQMRLSDA